MRRIRLAITPLFDMMKLHRILHALQPTTNGLATRRRSLQASSESDSRVLRVSNSPIGLRDLRRFGVRLAELRLSR